MKRNVYIMSTLMIIMLIITGSSFAQLGFRVGPKAGYNWATVADTSLSGQSARKAIGFGLALEFNFFSLFSIEADAVYSPRGATLENDGSLRLNYISVPIVLKKKFLPALIHPYILAGSEINFLMNAEENGNDIKDELKSQYFCLVVGGGLELSLLGKGAFIEARYTHGFTDVWKGDERSLKNNVFSLFVGILL